MNRQQRIEIQTRARHSQMTAKEIDDSFFKIPNTVASGITSSIIKINNEKNNQSKSIVKKKIGRIMIRWGFFCASIIWLLYLFIIGRNEDQKLIHNGICTKAYVYKKKHIGAKGDINTYYEFVKDGNYYYGISYNDDAQVGDTIVIVYLESDPHINRSNSKLNKNCSSDIISPEPVHEDL